MTDKSTRLKKFYSSLFRYYGPQNWWPADSELECILGAILTQNTSWKNVVKSIQNLKKQRLISLKKLALIPIEELAQLIRSSGYFNQKSNKIKNFVKFVFENYNGKLEEMLNEDISGLRKKLLSIKGIGPETTDSILLYACKKPIFVVDAYTFRILSRHGLIPEQTFYEEMQELFMDSLPRDTQIYNEYHALFVKVGKEHCKKKPICKGCPLEYDPHTV